MKHPVPLLLLLLVGLPLHAQRVLSLDSCRALALRNNKLLKAAQMKETLADNVRKAAKTKYLPKVDALGSYAFFSKEVSLLNSDQKALLGALGTTAVSGVSGNLTAVLQGAVQQGLLTPEAAQRIGASMSRISTGVEEGGNALGHDVLNAFETDTRNVFAATVMLRQPIYMGGAITALNNMAETGRKMAANTLDLTKQNILFETENTYWTVVALKQKEALAHSYRDLVKKLSDDVHKMIKEGVATRADGLKVDVAVNTADMQVTQVENGVTLAKMLLCQLCGISMDEPVTLADEATGPTAYNDFLEKVDVAWSPDMRPELRVLGNVVEMTKQTTKLMRATYLPQVMLTGGYMISNPNVYNGFQNKFAGVWNVGVLVRIPVWNWFEGSYRVRAGKAATSIAMLDLADATEKIELQLSQSSFKLTEARKRLATATRNMEAATENLRCANLGFKEGVINLTDVMGAQTAWQQAKSQKIDAEVDLILTHLQYEKALGTLQL